MTLVLPNFTTTKLGPQYAPTQLIFVSVLSLILYGVFVFVQSIRHRDHFLVTTRTARRRSRRRRRKTKKPKKPSLRPPWR